MKKDTYWKSFWDLFQPSLASAQIQKDSVVGGGSGTKAHATGSRTMSLPSSIAWLLYLILVSE